MPPRHPLLMLGFAALPIGCVACSDTYVRVIAPLEAQPDMADAEDMGLDMRELAMVSSGDFSAGGLGWLHSCVLRDQKIYCWGLSPSRAAVESASSLEPELVDASRTWTAISSGGESACAADDIGQLWCWGVNRVGELGQGDIAARVAPAVVTLPGQVAHFDFGDSHVCAVLDAGQLYCWGLDNSGQLGRGEGASPQALSPSQVAAARDWAQVSAGVAHTCAIKRNGQLYCWGRNSQGQLGIGEVTQREPEPVRVGTKSDWVEVSAGSIHTCGIRRGGTLWCFGESTSGVLGVAELPRTRQVEPVQLGEGRTWRTVAISDFKTCAVDTMDELWCTGRNLDGELGLEGPDRLEALTQIAAGVDPSGGVALGLFHACIWRDGGPMYCAGKNDDGRLGYGDKKARRGFDEFVFFTE
ncbi:MAG: hypothetical protein AAGI01_01190 [Myxococcota bacterium]